MVPAGLVRRCLGKPYTEGRLILFTPLLLAIALARQCCFGAALFTGLQVVTVLLDFLDDVFLLHLTLEAAKSILQRFAFLDNDFGQKNSPTFQL